MLEQCGNEAGERARLNEYDAVLVGHGVGADMPTIFFASC